MNESQRKILIGVAVIVGLMLLYPPYQIGQWEGAYSWIFKSPSSYSRLNVGQLLTQWLGVAIVGAIAFFLAKSETHSKEKEQPSLEGTDVDSSEKYFLYREYLGPQRRDRYLKLFDEFDNQPSGKTTGWNWSAFLFTGFWSLYRKMYSWFFGFWALVTLLGVLEKASPGLSFIIGLPIAIAFGRRADWYYYKTVNARITKAKRIQDPSKFIDKLRKIGSVHAVVLWLGIAMPVIGIASAIALPMLVKNKPAGNASGHFEFDEK